MASITIETGWPEKESITLIISPSEAWRIIEEFKNKYPNSERTNQGLQMFLDRWASKKEK
jgi:hypothetical protein